MQEQGCWTNILLLYHTVMTDHSPRRLSPQGLFGGIDLPDGGRAGRCGRMLDEINESLRSSCDQNSYTMGRMGAHNAVMAVMPEIGNNQSYPEVQPGGSDGLAKGAAGGRIGGCAGWREIASLQHRDVSMKSCIDRTAKEAVEVVNVKL